MGNYVAVTFEELPSARTIKVHGGMCSELLNLVIKVLKVFPEIEAARPRCSSGIEALCLLNNGIAKAKSLLQYCSESSVLYLALTGDAILSRCKRSRNILEQSLSLIQNMVPVLLASKISGIIMDLRSASFYLDPLEEEAGKVLRELLHIYGSTIDSTEETSKRAIQIASSQLHITSQKSLLIEKRSIKKLLNKFSDTDQNKKKILLLFLNLLRKYGKVTKEQNGHDITERIDPVPFASPYHSIGEVELHMNYRSEEAEINMLTRLVPPEEFMCPLSSRLMHDPVVIASGQTYERAWIQKWFDEGNDTCPKTKMKLAHLFFTSNTNMKDLILKWCATHSVFFPDRKIKETLLNSREASMNSIASLSSSMNDLNLSLDFSNVSFESTQGSMNSIDVKPSFEINLEFLSKFSSLPWDSRVQGVNKLLEQNNEFWSSVSSENIVQLLIGFLKDAHELHDVEAMVTGCQLLLKFVQKHSTTYMDGEAHVLLASLLDTEVSKQALSIIQLLSFHQNLIYEIQSSGALTGILNILESQVQELLEPSLIILTNLSRNNDLCSLIVPSKLIPKLIPLTQENTLARHCITILKNLCDNPDARVAIAETEGSISSLVKILESETHEEQEHAVCVLLSLCSQRVDYCQLVMDEGVIPGLVNISVNGNKKAKVMALELLRILKDEFSSTTEEECSKSDDMGKEEDDRRPRKVGGLFGRIFSKQSASSNKKR